MVVCGMAGYRKECTCMGYVGYRAVGAGKEGIGTLWEIVWPEGCMEEETEGL